MNIDLSNFQKVFYAKRNDKELHITNYGQDQDMICVCFSKNEKMIDCKKNYLMVENGMILAEIPENLIGNPQIFLELQNLSRNDETKIIKIQLPYSNLANLMVMKPINSGKEKQTAIDYFVINENDRQITVPNNEKIFGVESDDKSEEKHFKCKRFIDNELDLLQMSIRIIWQNANGEKGKYIVENVTEDGEFVTFKWLLSRNVTAYKGNIKFIVCAIKSNPEGVIINEWNTTLCDGTVLQGLEVATSKPEQPPQDTLEQLLRMISDIKSDVDRINSALCWQ